MFEIKPSSIAKWIAYFLPFRFLIEVATSANEPIICAGLCLSWWWSFQVLSLLARLAQRMMQGLEIASCIARQPQPNLPWHASEYQKIFFALSLYYNGQLSRRCQLHSWTQIVAQVVHYQSTIFGWIFACNNNCSAFFGGELVEEHLDLRYVQERVSCSETLFWFVRFARLSNLQGCCMCQKYGMIGFKHALQSK